MCDTQAGFVNHVNEVREVRGGVFEPQIVNTRYSCSCLVYSGYFDIFLHILASLFVLVTRMNFFFFVFKVHLFVKDLVSIVIRF